MSRDPSNEPNPWFPWRCESPGSTLLGNDSVATVGDKAQPTILRENTSVTKAAYTKPERVFT
ncbi:hypothetical protein HHJ81_11720 [Mobiluncus mulieris]|uniref:hypothetical protein n=1 Tax=Mobiluncus mulieris TaxID=2052 RepID=UPI0014706EB5|nr:hypothetical protein [Mobiluncus mulieris]NMW61709.1 hypothetical protein [Mobiluncus mulieris]